MTLILDNSGLLSAIDAGQRFHQVAKEALERAAGPLILSPFVLAVLDYVVLAGYGPSEELALLDEIKRGAYYLESFSTEDVEGNRDNRATCRLRRRWFGRRLERGAR